MVVPLSGAFTYQRPQGWQQSHNTAEVGIEIMSAETSYAFISSLNLSHLFGCNWIFVYAPAVAEAVGQLEDGQNQLSLGGTSFL